MKRNTALFSGLVLALSLSAASAHAAVDFGGARYVRQADAAHTEKTKGTLSLDAGTKQLTFSDKDQQPVVIPYAAINTLRLDNSIARLHRPFTQRVGREEFLTVEYSSGNAPQYAVFQLNGKSYRELLAALETQTGKQVAVKSN